MSATRKKNEPSISCTAQQRLALIGHWKQPYSNFIFCHLNDVSCEKPLLAYSEEETRTRLMASDITDVLSAILFLFQPLIFIFVPLFSFYNLLFVNSKFDFCFLFTVSNQEVYCVSVYIYCFFIAWSVCFSVNISPIWYSILFFWPKFLTSRRFTKKYLKFYLKTVPLCGHREAQQVLSCFKSI